MSFVFVFLAVSVVEVLAADQPKLVWADEFDQAEGSAPKSTNWVYELGGDGWGNNELQTYTDVHGSSRECSR
jgi:hypothetical protein